MDYPLLDSVNVANADIANGISLETSFPFSSHYDKIENLLYPPSDAPSEDCHGFSWDTALSNFLNVLDFGTSFWTWNTGDNPMSGTNSDDKNESTAHYAVDMGSLASGYLDYNIAPPVKPSPSNSINSDGVLESFTNFESNREKGTMLFDSDVYSRDAIQRSGKSAPQRSKLDSALVEKAFTEGSHYPDEYRKGCLNRTILLRVHQQVYLEPTQQSAEGLFIVGEKPLVETGTGSIYRLFVDLTGKTCLFCGKSQASLDRSLGCVRKHLGHRPFVCSGICPRCIDKDEPARFFSRARLDEHLKGPNRKQKCPQRRCDAQVLYGNLKRHWKKKHPWEPYPDDPSRRR